ncbi:MAG: STT3 domain-containing protein [Candidatus Woesearchaeota archaeon]
MSNESQSDDNIEIDFSRLKKYFTPKVINIIVLTLLILIPVILAANIRLQAWNLPATDSWAQSSVENYYRNQISQQVSTQYPNLPVTQRNKLVDDQWIEFQKTNQAEINEQVKQTSQYFKTGLQYTENNNTYTFLGDLDSYFYLRQARNIEQKGYVCDYIDPEEGCIDALMVAQETRPAQSTLHPYATFYLYKFLHFFNSKINLMQSAFILPTAVIMIAVIAAFFVGRRLMNDVAGFFAAMFLATSPMLISRTMGSDTDIWNITFPIIIIWFFLEAFRAKKMWLKITLTVATGLAFAFFNFAWSGWWYIFYFMLAALIGHMAFVSLRKYLHTKSVKNIFDQELRDDTIILGVLFVSTALFVTLIYSFATFIAALNAPLMLSETLKVAAAENLWPNVLTTVAELNEADISTVILQASSGMTFMFILALLGIIFTLVKKEPDIKDYTLIVLSAIIYTVMITKFTKINYIVYLLILLLPVILGLWFNLRGNHKHDIKPALILIIWLIGMIYTSTKGVRFIFLLVPAFCIALGIAIGYIYQYLEKILKKHLSIPETISKIGVFLILCLMLITPISAGLATGESYVPSITKGWGDSLTKIDQEAAPDAIITSWWDFGHWFKYFADRRVTFDGASQLGPLAHWVGSSLQTSSERENIGILRMLGCGSNKAFENVDKKFNDTETSQNIISDIILLDKDDAENYLKDTGFNDNEINDILKYSHCSPPEMYYITSGDMIGKSGVWAHFGTWNIDKAYIINNLRNKPLNEAVQVMKDRWNYTDEQASSIYYEVQALTTDREMNDWIAPWPSYATGSMVPCQNASIDLVYCNLNLGIGGNSQQSIVLERAFINLSNPEQSYVSLGIYDASSGARLGENIAIWNTVVIADEELVSYTPTNATVDLGVLLNVIKSGNSTSYSALISNTLLIESTFTKLFYLDGKYMTHFEKVSDTSDITGTRIIVWKVKFD